MAIVDCIKMFCSSQRWRSSIGTLTLGISKNDDLKKRLNKNVSFYSTTSDDWGLLSAYDCLVDMPAGSSYASKYRFLTGKLHVAVAVAIFLPGSRKATPYYLIKSKPSGS